MKIAISAGEASGDHLGAAVIQEIKTRIPNATFYGIAGKKMIAAGCEPIYPMDKLSVMGITDVIKKLPQLLSIRKNFKNYILHHKPDVFVGIDAPDFHLSLEKKLKKKGIKTLHYVSPSVWAWRKGRIKTIQKAVDKILTLFPFEQQFYQDHDVDALFVGHPMAAEIAKANLNQAEIRQKLEIPPNTTVIAILPGSRKMEIEQLASIYLETAKWMHQKQPGLYFVIPAANNKLKLLLEKKIDALDCPLPIALITGQAREVITASDVVLATSGTITLETMLLKKPLVVAYKMSRLNWLIAKLLVDIEFFSLPNILAKRKIVPEFLQQRVTVPNLGHALFEWIHNLRAQEALLSEYENMAKQLNKKTNSLVADNVLSLIQT